MKTHKQNIIYESRFTTNNNQERSIYDHMSTLDLLRAQLEATGIKDKENFIRESLLRVGSILAIGLISYLLVLIF